MGEKRLPELLTQMRAAITNGDMTACLQLQEKIEEQWDAISDALEKESLDANRLQDVLSDLARGVW